MVGRTASSPRFPYTTLFRSLVAANLTQLVVVAAPVPEPDWLVVDRYLVAAELAGLSALVVMNKADLAERPAHHLRSEEHTSELQSREKLECRLLHEKKK